MGLRPRQRRATAETRKDLGILSGLRDQPDEEIATSKTKQRKATPPRKRPDQGFPVLPVAVGALLVVALAVTAFIAVTNSGSGAKAVNRINCDSTEQIAVHYHAHLTLIREGTEISVPGNIGISTSPSCLYWMHTHSSDGIIHIEAPQAQQNRVFTLGDFFAVWGQPLSTTQVATLQVDGSHQLKIYGQPYTGDPAAIPLRTHTQVVIEIVPPPVDPPPAFTFPQGL
jgi:hypothetical protein